MKAFELQGEGLESLTLVDRDQPTPGPGEVLVRIRAAALNPRDLQVAAGRYPPDGRRPLTPISDGVGEVIGIGPDVGRVAVGDRVAGAFAPGWISGPRRDEVWGTLGAHLNGVLAEYVALPQEGVVQVPPHLSDEEAATLPCAAVTAWQALIALGNTAPGETVVILGTGGVSLFAVQFALLAGSRPIVVSRSEARLARARELGAEDGIDSTRDPDWQLRVPELTDGEGADHVLDVVGDLNRCAQALRIGGTVSQIGYVGGLTMEVEVFSLLLANARVQAITVGPRQSFEAMNAAIALHEVRPVVGRTFAFEEAPQAFAELARGEHFGKLVVSYG